MCTQKFRRKRVYVYPSVTVLPRCELLSISGSFFAQVRNKCSAQVQKLLSACCAARMLCSSVLRKLLCASAVPVALRKLVVRTHKPSVFARRPGRSPQVLPRRRRKNICESSVSPRKVRSSKQSACAPTPVCSRKSAGASALVQVHWRKRACASALAQARLHTQVCSCKPRASALARTRPRKYAPHACLRASLLVCSLVALAGDFE